MGGQDAGGGDPDPENTLDVESTIRMRYLQDKIREAYYANLRVGQDVLVGEGGREEMERASPELTLKIMLYAKYLFLEIWQSRFLYTPIDDILEEMRAIGRPGLEGILWQDEGTRRLVEKMRHQFSAHPYFTLERTVGMMEEIGFDGFWQAARRILMFKDAVTIVRHERGSLERLGGKDMEISKAGPKALTDAEMAKMRWRYAGPPYDIAWGKDNPKEVMQECSVCIRMLRDELETSSALHQIYNTRESLVRLVGASYNLKFMILEMRDFIRRFAKLDVPARPGFLDRKKKYNRYRGRYSAHDDGGGRITSLMQILKDTELVSMIHVDMEEAILVSGRLFPAYVPRAQIELPTRDRIAEMEGEIGGVRERFRGQIGEELIEAYEADCERHRGRVDRALGLAG